MAQPLLSLSPPNTYFAHAHVYTHTFSIQLFLTPSLLLLRTQDTRMGRKELFIIGTLLKTHHYVRHMSIRTISPLVRTLLVLLQSTSLRHTCSRVPRPTFFSFISDRAARSLRPSAYLCVLDFVSFPSAQSMVANYVLSFLYV